MLNRFHRRSIRLKDYDYSREGAYFVTIRTNNGKPLFGNIMQDKMHLNECGKYVNDFWFTLPKRYNNIELDEFIVMPNHLHGIIVISENPVRAIHELPLRNINTNKDTFRKNRRSMLLPNVIGYFKMNTAKEINKLLSSKGKLWQRNYYEHIIRNETDLNNIRNYIYYNPLKWAWDKENPDRIE